ncbi:MAG: UDP binding domain-containing protein, partial [Pelovirga sp.]
EIGYNPQVILAGRRINDGMAKHVAEMTVKNLIHADKAVKGARVLVLGLTFKENVPDIRNSKVADILSELQEYDVNVLVHDPVADADAALHEYGVTLISLAAAGQVDAVIWAVAHDQFQAIGPHKLQELCDNGNGRGVVMDVKSVLERDAVEAVGLRYWSL